MVRFELEVHELAAWVLVGFIIGVIFTALFIRYVLNVVFL